MTNVAEIINKVGVEVIKSDEEFECDQTLPSNYCVIRVDVSKCSTLDEFTKAFKESSSCRDDIIGADDLYDKIIDLYWINIDIKPIIIFEHFDQYIESCDSFDRDITIRLLMSIDRFWKVERLPHYTAHSECLYVVMANGIELRE